MPKFNPPNMKNLEEDPRAQALSGLGQTAAALPALYRQYQIEKQKQALQQRELEEQMRQFDVTSGISSFNAQTNRINAEKEKPLPQYALFQKDAKGNVIDEKVLEPGVKPVVVGPTGGSGAYGTFADRQSNTLRKEFNRLSEAYNNSIQAYNEGVSAATQETGVGDASLMRAIVKVAEGKGARVSDADVEAFAMSGSIPQNLQATMLKALKGQKLAPEVRNQFMALLEEYKNKAEERQKLYEEQYTKQAQQYQVDPNKVVVDYKPQPAPTAPQAAGEMIRVRRKADGKTGSIPAKNFNPDKYEKI